LDEKVFAAMEKLGLSTPGADDDGVDENGCKDGVCPMPTTTDDKKEETAASSQDPVEMADRIAKDLDVDSYMAMAAIGATSTLGAKNVRTFDESAARAMIQTELDLIAAIPEDSEDVQTLVGEGFEVFMSRRALAFSENNLNGARAILLAEQMDAEEEAAEEAAKAAPKEAAPTDISFDFEPMAATPSPAPMESHNMPTSAPNDFVEIKTNYDPTKLPAAPTPAPATEPANPAMPKAARKEDVVFECTTDQLQEIVLESPVPVLLDVYADWCGPCKALGPALEDMAIKSGGMFRLVKLNSDNEKPVSQALEVTALPTVIGISEGKIVHMFQGMPKSQEMMQNFMMGLFGAAQFNPSITTEQMEKYKELTNKLIKVASAASFSFSMRERLTEIIEGKMDAIVKDDSVEDVEESARLIKTFLNNVINNPYEDKFRKINLANKIVAAKVGQNKSCVAVLKSVGFTKTGTDMFYKADKRVINIAPLVVARDCIEKWIQRNRKEMAALARKRKDDLLKANLVFEEEEEEEETDVEAEEVDPTACKLKLRLDGKNKIHDVTLHQDDTLSKILEELQVDTETEEEIQITCVAKRLVVKVSDSEAMAKTLKEHRLMPGASVVVKVGTTVKADVEAMKERAATKRAQKTGSHTMQSIGVYSTEDNNKSNLIDGGGGVLYEHDITDTEDEGEEEEAKDDVAEDITKAAEEEAVETEEETAAATP